ncbi:MAG: DNA internalization-related competence protein ComEC/Rec2 [Myxococcales bacterium]
MGGRPLLAASAAFVAGASIGIGCERGPAGLAALTLASVAGMALALLRRPSRRASPVGHLPQGAALVLALALGLLRGAVAPRPARDGVLLAWLRDPASSKGGREPLPLEGEVLEATPARDGARILLRVEARGARPGAPPAAPPPGLRALLFGPRSLHRGDRIRGIARLREPPRALNPGAQDVRKELGLRGIALVGTLEPAELEVLRRGPAFYRLLDERRARFARRCQDVCSTPARGALVAALGVGDRSDLPPEADDALAESGLVHLLSSAGLHLAALAFLVRWAGRKLLVRTRLGPRAAALSALAALPAALADVLLLGASWPAVRAGAGAALGLAAPLFSRRSDALTALGLAAATCAIVDPAATRDLALQLSLLGVLGLIVLTRPLRELLPIAAPAPGARTRTRRALEHALQLCCATAAATLCTAPLLAAAFHRLSLVSVAANALGLLPGLAAVPLATLAVPLDAVAPQLALPLFFCADALAGAVLFAARLFAALPHAVIRLPAPGPFTALAWICFVGALAGFPSPGLRAAQERPRPRVRLLRASVPLALLCVSAAARAVAVRRSTAVTATFLAVGQGDAALVQLPGGHAILIDGGGDLRGLPDPAGGRGRDPGARDLLPALAELGVSRLDVVVLTHPHPDHAGGLPTLLRHVPVGELWLTGEPGPGDIGGRVAGIARAQGVSVRTPRHGPQDPIAGGVSVEVLHPVPSWDPGRTTNDNSLVLRLVHGKVAMLFPGDIEALAESALAQGAEPLEAQLLKAPHHGSRTSSTDAFLRRVRPRAVVYSVGEGNPFGFPHADVLARTQRLGAESLLRTDAGAITAVSDGVSLQLSQRAPVAD